MHCSLCLVSIFRCMHAPNDSYSPFQIHHVLHHGCDRCLRWTGIPERTKKLSNEGDRKAKPIKDSCPLRLYGPQLVVLINQEQLHMVTTILFHRTQCNDFLLFQYFSNGSSRHENDE